ncbi:MAG TPA: GAF domain-containing SpoIIE family protein phosphatase [Rectinemataceae bacterium]|nr:GAF domain-containing SpoIIE family protein phosphatase [Rectinemataceae bacterium]
MMWDSIVRASSGPLLVKLALAAVLLAAFLFLRKRETEGVMTGYALLAAFLGLRDILFAAFPLPDLYRASDLILFGTLLVLGAKFSRSGLALWLTVGLDAAALVALILDAALGIIPAVPHQYYLVVALAPILVGAVLTARGRSQSDTAIAELGAKAWLPLLAGSIVYLGGATMLGPESALFQTVFVPLFYALLFSLGFFYVNITQDQLIRAVDYYEESVDSLYELLLATGSAMKADFALQDVLDNMLKAIVERTGAEGGVLLLTDEFEDSISVRSVQGSCAPPFKLPESLPRSVDRVSAFLRHARFRLGEGVLGEVAQTGKHFFAASGDDPRLPDNGDEDWIRPGGVIVAPLIVRDRVIGAICVTTARSASFTERDFDRCKLLANFGSIAVANSFTFLEAAERSDIEREAAIAEDVQKTMVPKKLPELPGLSFGAFTSPARGVCSDYYDIIQTRPDRAVLVIGDVAGKGVAASLVMVMVRSILHLITNSTKDAATLLQWINRGVSGKVDLDHYATIGLVAADASTGSLEFANAGHPPILIYRSNADAIETVEIKSVPVGVERTTSYSAKRIALGAGDVLVMYTDGIVETMNVQGKQYGRKNLGNVIQRSHSLPAREIAERIRTDLLDFAGASRQHDDQTVLVMKAKN